MDYSRIGTENSESRDPPGQGARLISVRRMRGARNGLIVFAVLINAGSWANAEPTPAKALSERFYKKQDVCADARKADPAKKLALILLSTHLCDAGTHVCLDSLRTITDEANVFVKQNFVVYQSRFYSFDLDKSGTINQLYYSGENEIRREWKKTGVNPDVAIMDLRSCQVLGSSLVMSYPRAFNRSFVDRYLAFRKLITDIPGVAAEIGPDATAPEAIKSEVAEIEAIRAKGIPEQTLTQAYLALMQESDAAGLRVVGSQVFIQGYSSVGAFIDAARRRYSDPTMELFITTSGVLLP